MFVRRNKFLLLAVIASVITSMFLDMEAGSARFYPSLNIKLQGGKKKTPEEMKTHLATRCRSFALHVRHKKTSSLQALLSDMPITVCRQLEDILSPQKNNFFLYVFIQTMVAPV